MTTLHFPTMGWLIKHNLVVSDGVEEVVIARVEHGVHHAAGDSKHGSTAILDLNIEGTVTGVDVLDLSGVASRDEGVVAGRKVLGSSGVLAGGHGDSLGKKAKEKDLYQGRMDERWFRQTNLLVESETSRS